MEQSLANKVEELEKRLTGLEVRVQEQPISVEKKEWLKSIGAGEFPVPVKFIYNFNHIYNVDTNTNWFLDFDYVKNTSIEDLKAQYEKNKELFENVYLKQVKKSLE